MKRMILLIIMIIPLIFCSCTKAISYLPGETTNLSVNSLKPNQDEKLPENFTVDKIKSVFLEYINYRLWLYPSKIMDAATGKEFDSYIGKSIDVEICVYNNSNDSVFVRTNIGQWLGVFKINRGFVYCEGQVSEGEYGWPGDKENYKVIEKYSITIPEPHKPSYGTSQRKDKMIAALESAIKASCEDFYKGADKYYDEWINADVYIVDFYEYENGTHAWLCRQDGSITDYPVVFEEKNNEIKVQTVKGYSLNDKNQFNEFGRFQFDRDISDAVKHFKCNVQ